MQRALSHREALHFILRYVGAAKVALLAFMLLATSLSEGIGLLLLVPVTQVIIGGANEGAPGWLAQMAVIPPGLLLTLVAGLVCLRAGLVFATNQLRTSIDLSFKRDLRKDAHRALVRAEWRWLAGRHSAEHEALILGEANRVGTLVDQALFLVSASLTLLALIGAALLISPSLTIGVLAVAALLALPLLILKGRTSRDAESYADAYADLHTEVSGGLSHLRSARIAGAGGLLEDRFAAASEQLRETEWRYIKHGHILVALVQGLAAILLAGLVYYALVEGDVPLSLFVPLLALLARAAPLAGTILQGARQWRHAQPALARLRSLIYEAESHAETSVARNVGKALTLKESIRLTDVRLSFEGRDNPVFVRLNCSIPAGDITAVVGPSGSGKSSLADLVSGLLEPDDGAIHVDDVLLVGEDRMHWREHVAYAEQSPYLFSGTVEENVVWAMSGRSREEIDAALAAASATFVTQLPEGLKSPVMEDGRSFSGGERQRLALARALLRDPQLLILDEVTASLDKENRETIRETVQALRGRCTILILTHDDDLAQLADHVIDLGEGSHG